MYCFISNVQQQNLTDSFEAAKLRKMKVAKTKKNRLLDSSKNV